MAGGWGGRLPDLHADGARVMGAGYVAVVGVRVMENLQARSVISYTCVSAPFWPTASPTWRLRYIVMSCGQCMA